MTNFSFLKSNLMFLESVPANKNLIITNYDKNNYPQSIKSVVNTMLPLLYDTLPLSNYISLVINMPPLSKPNLLKHYQTKYFLLNNKMNRIPSNNNKLNQFNDDSNTKLEQFVNFLNENIVPTKQKSIIDSNNAEPSNTNQKILIERRLAMPLSRQRLQRTGRNNILSAAHPHGDKTYQIRNINDIGWFRFGRK